MAAISAELDFSRGVLWVPCKLLEFIQKTIHELEVELISGRICQLIAFKILILELFVLIRSYRLGFPKVCKHHASLFTF